ncbi:family 1 glycosylhydrolase [Streptomyces sp. NPDC059009]|uniref:family 1 glycosylhydrolase n=1 Tax=Streptomyces sp. NPDC059009 TaxID=3346694 RepID=UPI0036826EA6
MSDAIDLAALPHDFLWGTATSAYQIEGAVAEDGRSPSIWDTFSHTPGKIAGDDHGDDACDHYHRWREDIGLMRRLGANAYRLSIAWPRVLPGGDRPEDVAAARRADGHTNRWWLDPVHGRGFPADMQDVYGVQLPERQGDMETIATPLDWLGLNYYFPATVADDPDGPAPRTRDIRVPDVPRTAMDWEIDATGIETLLLRLTHDYGARKLYVTENGSAYPDVVRADGTVDDPERADYLERHLAACARATRQGAPLAGYFAWSLLDNFEWAYGYDKRFGLVHVDYATQRRTIKGSGHRYADLVRRHGALARRAA